MSYLSDLQHAAKPVGKEFKKFSKTLLKPDPQQFFVRCFTLALRLTIFTILLVYYTTKKVFRFY